MSSRLLSLIKVLQAVEVLSQENPGWLYTQDPVRIAEAKQNLIRGILTEAEILENKLGDRGATISQIRADHGIHE